MHKLFEVYLPCLDAAGYVHQLGSAVTSLKIGDRVFVTGSSSNSGSYAQFVVSDDTYVFPLHERLSFAQVSFWIDIMSSYLDSFSSSKVKSTYYLRVYEHF